MVLIVEIILVQSTFCCRCWLRTQHKPVRRATIKFVCSEVPRAKRGWPAEVTSETARELQMSNLEEVLTVL